MNQQAEFRGLKFSQKVGQALTNGSVPSVFIIYSLVGVFLAMARIVGGPSPFGVAYLAAIPVMYTLPATIGVSVGYLFTGSISVGFRYIAAGFLVTFFRFLVEGTLIKKSKIWLTPLTASVAVFITGVLPMLYSDPLIYDVIMWVTQIIIAGGAAGFIKQASRAVSSKKIEDMQLLSIWVLYVLILMGLDTISVADVSLGRVAVGISILMASKISGVSGSTLIGVIGGFAVGFSSGDFTLYGTVYGLGGLLVGLFGNLGKFGSSLALAMSYGITMLFTQGITSGYIEIAISVIGFLMIPEFWFKMILAKIQDTKDNSAVKSLITERMGDTAQVLKDVSDTTKDVASRLNKIYKQNAINVYDVVGEKICKNCPQKTKCWVQGYSHTVSGIDKGMNLLKSGVGLSDSSCPSFFTHCQKRSKIAGVLVAVHKQQQKSDNGDRLATRTRNLFIDQLEGMSMLLDDLIGQVDNIYTQDHVLAAKIEDIFQGCKLEPQRAVCWKNSQGQLSVMVEIPQYKEARASPEFLTSEISHTAGLSVGYPTVTRKNLCTRMIFKEQPRYAIEYGSCQISPSKNTLCGDSFRIINSGDNIAHLLLSDGMGNGNNAAVDSAMTASLISRMLQVGTSYETAIKMLNGALLVKSREESLATIDAAEIDLYSGKVTFYKAGAAPTIVRKDGRGIEVSATSLPAGILDGVEFSKSCINLEEGDLVVLMSDGATGDSDNKWIGKIVEGYSQTDLDQLCQKIANTAKLRRGDGREDDITVLCCRLALKEQKAKEYATV